MLGAVSVSAFAPDDDVFAFLKTTTHVNVKIDFSNADVENYSADEFARFSESHYDTVMVHFLYEMNKKFAGKNIAFGQNENTTYLFLVQVNSIEEDGAVRANTLVIDLNTVSQLCSFKVKAHGGVFGDFDQLFVEGMARLGENIADYVLEKIE